MPESGNGEFIGDNPERLVAPAGFIAFVQNEYGLSEPETVVLSELLQYGTATSSQLSAALQDPGLMRYERAAEATLGKLQKKLPGLVNSTLEWRTRTYFLENDARLTLEASARSSFAAIADAQRVLAEWAHGFLMTHLMRTDASGHQLLHRQMLTALMRHAGWWQGSAAIMSQTSRAKSTAALNFSREADVLQGYLPAGLLEKKGHKQLTRYRLNAVSLAAMEKPATIQNSTGEPWLAGPERCLSALALSMVTDGRRQYGPFLTEQQNADRVQRLRDERRASRAEKNKAHVASSNNRSKPANVLPMKADEGRESQTHTRYKNIPPKPLVRVMESEQFTEEERVRLREIKNWLRADERALIVDLIEHYGDEIVPVIENNSLLFRHINGVVQLTGYAQKTTL